MACAIQQNSSYLIILVQVVSNVLFMEFSISTVERSREKNISAKTRINASPDIDITGWIQYRKTPVPDFTRRLYV